jgi:hypothetical protein
MLHTLSVMFVAAAAAAAGASPAAPTRPMNAVPPIGVTVIVGRGIPPALVTRILEETDTIWRGSGFTFAWLRETGLPTTLRLTIDNAAGMRVDGATTLGWIRFDEHNVPDPEIHLSYSNAIDLLRLSIGVVGDTEHMPRAERELLLGRAMGRALAHEMGHYLLASKAHTEKGLMATKRSAVDLFSAQREHFRIDDVQRLTMAARFTPPVASASNRGARASKQD